MGDRSSCEDFTAVHLPDELYKTVPVGRKCIPGRHVSNNLLLIRKKIDSILVIKGSTYVKTNTMHTDVCSVSLFHVH